MTTQTLARPKTNPLPGDALEKDGRRRYVVERFHNSVIYHRGDSSKEHECWISTWMDWARNAEVIALGTAA